MCGTAPLIVAMVAGETSGDILGAGLIQALKAKHPNIRFVGIGGALMQAQGLQSWFDMEQLAVMGLVEVLARLPTILSIRRQLTTKLLALKPDVFIGIDAPDFNLTLEKKLKLAGIKTIHYVSPSVWAWRQNRIHTIAEATNLVLAFLPFEKAFYDRFHVPCRFIGHTLADVIPLTTDQQQAKRQLGLSENVRYIALLPGSRASEMRELASIFIQTAQLLYQDDHSLQFLVPLVNSARRAQFTEIWQQMAADLPIHLFDGHSRTVMIASDAALLASGTATLECMLCKCPMVVGYKMNALTFWLAKRLVKTPYVALPNLLADELLVPELLQQQCQPPLLAAELKKLLQDSARQRLQSRFQQLHQQIRCQADQQAANAVLELTDYGRRE